MPRRRLRAAVAVVLLMLGTVTAAEGARPVQPEARGRLLDVPYLTQTEDLCGGAAVAMVMRYWGERQIVPDDFASLIDRSAAGIRTSALTADVGRRGWQALPYAAEPASGTEWLRGHVDNGRPVVALIEVRPNRYHYLVIVAVTDDRVIAHDPAQAPFQVTSRTAFERAWAAADRWALLILPPAEATAVRTPALDPSESRGLREWSGRPGIAGTVRPDHPDAASHDRESGSALACDALVQAMVARARSGDVDGAEGGLLDATRLCANEAAAWRELAGVRFLQSRWAEAGDLAARAAQLEPTDVPTWDLLATSRFMDGQAGAALDAWNQVGKPVVDLVRIEGASRTRQPVIVDRLDLLPRALLTRERHARAARRLAELPSAVSTRLAYRPRADGIADVEAAVVERASLPRGVAPVIATAGRAAMQRELRLDASSPTGSGELWSVAWRWWEARPAASFSLALPMPARRRGIATIEGSWERQSYGRRVDDDGSAVETTLVNDRRRAAVRLSDWATSRVRWEAALALDRWAEGRHPSAEVAIDTRHAGDRLSIAGDTAAWATFGSGRRFARGRLSAAWRSSLANDRPAWLATAGWQQTSRSAPLDLWPGASAGHGRAPLLRAHPLLARGVVVGDTFGRRLAHGTMEYQHPLTLGLPGALRLAAFVDTARAWDLPDRATRTRWQADAGLGLRIGFPGAVGMARLDVARGLRDGAMSASAAWIPPWPGRER